MAKDNLSSFNSRLDPELHQEFKVFAATTNISIQQHLAAALREYLDKQKAKKNG